MHLQKCLTFGVHIKNSSSSFLCKHCFCGHRSSFLWRYICFRKCDMFSRLAMQATLKSDITSLFAAQTNGRLRYDINPLPAPQGISNRRYIARDSVYRKSRKGFISLRSVLNGTTHRQSFLFLQKSSKRIIKVYKTGTFVPEKRNFVSAIQAQLGYFLEKGKIRHFSQKHLYNINKNGKLP